MILLIVPLLLILLVVAAVKAKRAGFEVAMIVVVGASDIRA